MSKVLEVIFTDTLMAWTGEYHVRAGDRFSTFYFRVPDEWGNDANLQGRVFAVAQKIYEDLNANFREAEPNDLGYLLVKGTESRALSEDEERATPWMRAENPAVWEWTPCVVADEGGDYEKVSREEF